MNHSNDRKLNDRKKKLQHEYKSGENYFLETSMENYFDKNTNVESVPIASLTKIMTYVITIENISDLDLKVIVPEGTKQEIIERIKYYKKRVLIKYLV